MLSKTWGRLILPACLLLAVPVFSSAEVEISVNFAPPELPVYEQPPIPGDGYVWTPGYWAWGEDAQDYYWVPGTWVLAPQPGYLWTPGYWGADGDAFFFHAGYWGLHVGFYGGVNYGYGYGGQGYEGGYWQGGRMYYNTSVNNISTTNITNVYNKTVINNVSVTRVSYNGGSGGVRAQPSASEQQAAGERHLPVTPIQAQHIQVARSNPVLRASQNNGRPPIAATARPAAFTGAGVVQATRGGAVHNPSQAQPRSERGQAPADQQRPQTGRAPMERQPGSRPPVEQQRPQADRAPMERQPTDRQPMDRQPGSRPPVEQQRPQAERAPMERQPMDRPPPPRPPVEQQRSQAERAPMERPPPPRPPVEQQRPQAERPPPPRPPTRDDDRHQP